MGSSEIPHFTVTMDIATIDANILGEYLRAEMFVGGGFGMTGWSEVRLDAIVIWGDDARAFMDLPDETWNHVNAHAYEWTQQGRSVIGGWFWDGDGVLRFEVWDHYPPNATLLRRIENPDCKKSYGWRDV